MRALKNELIQFISQSCTISYKIADNQDTEIAQDFIKVEKMYFYSQCNDAVACLTDVERHSDFSACVYDLSELCCGLYFESDSIVLSNY